MSNSTHNLYLVYYKIQKLNSSKIPKRRRVGTGFTINKQFLLGEISQVDNHNERWAQDKNKTAQRYFYTIVTLFYCHNPFSLTHSLTHTVYFHSIITSFATIGISCHAYDIGNVYSISFHKQTQTNSLIYILFDSIIF